MWTRFALLKLSKNNLREENHVHQLTVSRVRHSWLRVLQSRFFRGPRVLHHRTTPRTLPLLGMRFGGGPCPGAEGPLLAYRARWPQADLCPGQGGTRDLLPVRAHPASQNPLCRSPQDLHACIRTLRPGTVEIADDT